VGLEFDDKLKNNTRMFGIIRNGLFEFRDDTVRLSDPVGLNKGLRDKTQIFQLKEC